ncbi:hypothetical protein C7N43_36600 [Sphingobacteriales bacterium UPWRP_1]|nr:hypothetical protein C7N43_36600 [Sphingobacteriales bacterium UPWRP_1]
MGEHKIFLPISDISQNNIAALIYQITFQLINLFFCKIKLKSKCTIFLNINTKLVNKIDNCIAMGFFKNYRAFYPVLFVTKPYRDN